ncbi:acyl-CoA N-acyltransferase [Biscogniauxia marginata]|nr:acyl-CoA N-acyltransferase [Biscogniauxia marginata]
MPLELKKASTSDTEVILDAFLDAFHDHPADRIVFGSSSKQSREFWTKFIDDSLQDPNTHFVLITDTDSPPPKRVIAFAKWVEQCTTTYPTSMSQLPLPGNVNTAFADEFFGAMARKHEEIMGDRPHWYLESFGVRTEHQRKGLGGLLLRWGLERADEAQVEAFLDSSPAGADLYTKHGFETKESMTFDDGNYEEKFMVRQPKKL